MREVASLLLSFVIPGAGAIIVDALCTISQLVGEMRENEQMCRRVYQRLHFVKGELDKMTDVKMLRETRILAVYGDNISNFLKFLQKQNEKSFLKRFASSRKVAEAIAEFHTDMDDLFKLLHISHMTEMTKWREEMREDLDRIYKELKDLSMNTQVILQEIKSPQLLEGLAYMKYELTQKSGENDPKHRALMNLTVKKLLRTSGVTMPATPKWFIPGDEVEFEAEEDSGTFATVRRGTWGKGTDVVIKTLLIDDQRSKKSFFQEVEVWSALTNPHIISFFGACHVSTPAFFVCEDAVHGNFADFFLADKSKIWTLFHQAALGLHYLHSQKLVHGDLKCNNILVGADGKAKISDFGFSFIRSQSVGLSAKAQTDSVRWKAPECLMPAGDDVDAAHNPRFASDVYSFGMCIIEAFSDAVPFGMDADEEIIPKIFGGKAYPRPDGFQDDEWSLVQSLCNPKWRQRISLSDAIAELKAFADRENETEVPCVKCQEKISSSDCFCRFCRLCQTGRTLAVDSTDRFCKFCGRHQTGQAGQAA